MCFLLLLILVTLMRVNTSLKACIDTYPIKGEYKNKSFVPENCRINYYSMPQKIDCLANRKVWMIGNSIARQYAFHLVNQAEETKHKVYSRKEEKQRCPKESKGLFMHGSCSFHLPKNISILNSWIVYFYDNPDNKWAQDICSSAQMKTNECLHSIGLFNSTKNDILIFNFGIVYALWDPPNVTDIPKWQRQRINSFIDYLSQHFKGTTIWMNVTPAKKDQFGQNFDARVIEVNKRISNILLKNKKFKVFDNWSVNNHIVDKEGFYADVIHFPGELTELGWNIMLTEICG